jgi:hypothetical protein
MRLLVLGGLVVVAMGFALLYMVTHGAGGAELPPPAAPRAGVPESGHAAGGIPSAGDVSAPVHHTAPTLAPALAPAPALGPGRDGQAKPKHVDTPTDQLRWALMRAIRGTEPAVVDCLNQAKQAGTSVDGVSSYFFYVKRQGDTIVFDGATTEVSPYPEPLTSCLLNAAKGAAVDALPEDVQRVQVLRRLTVEHGDIAVYKLGAFHVVDPAP